MWNITRFDEPYAINANATQSCLLISGWSADTRIFEFLLPGLAQYFHVYRADIVDLEDEPSIFALVDDLAERLEQPVWTIGWSLGGNIAIELAHRHPDKVMGLCNIATTPCFVQHDDWPIGMPSTTFQQFEHGLELNVRRTIRKFDGLQVFDDAQESTLKKSLIEYRKHQELLPQEALLLCLEYLSDFDQREKIQHINKPFLWCFGGRDKLVNVYTSQEIKEMYPLHETELFVDTAHLPFLTKTDQFFKALLRLLDKDALQKDKQKVAASFSKAAGTYDDSAKLQQWVAGQLIEKVSMEEGFLLDAGCGTAYWSNRLAEKFDNIIGLDFAEGMLAYGQQQYGDSVDWLCADIENLPLKDQSVHGIFSSLAVQWVQDFSSLLEEWERVLHTGGKIWLATLGPKTLFELRESWGGEASYEHVNKFLSPDLICHKVSESSLTLKSLRVEHKVMHYEDIKALLMDLKNIGAQTVMQRRYKGLMGKDKFLRMVKNYESFRDELGMLPATYEVVFLSLEKSW